jgi:hypothetical protein
MPATENEIRVNNTKEDKTEANLAVISDIIPLVSENL